MWNLTGLIKKNFLLLLLSISFKFNLFSQNFKEVKGILPNLRYSQVQFLDYDCDNALDIFVWGAYDKNQEGKRSWVIYKNKWNDQFDSIMVNPSCNYGCSKGPINVADLNKDNVPEMVSIGNSNAFEFIQFNNNQFKKLPVDIGLIDNSYGCVYDLSFADFDNDGAPEINYNMSIYDTYKNIYNNLTFGKTFNEIPIWLDINNDGKIDIFNIHTDQYDSYSTSNIYLNTGSSFIKNSFNFNKLASAIEVGDYNNDGYEDLLITIYDLNTNTNIVELYKNDKKGSFIHIMDLTTALKGKFIDVDNDGDLDLVLLGHYDSSFNYYLKFYQNDGNDNFKELQNVSLQTDSNGDIRIGDYDNDGDNDILISSFGNSNRNITLYKNMLVETNPSKANKAPQIPQNLKATVNFNQVNFTWNSAKDTETPDSSISYNVYILKKDGSFAKSPIADIHSGFKRTVGKGNVGFRNFYTINCLEDGKYYWAVQAIDNSNKGSDFAKVDSFEIKGTTPEAPSQLIAKTISDKKINLTWKDNSTIEDGFIVEMFSDSIPNYRAAGFYPCQTVGPNIKECTIENLTQNTQYIFRVKAYNCSTSSTVSNSDTTRTYPPPFTKNIILDYAYGRQAEWGDFDRDGDLDLLMYYTQEDAYGKSFSRIFENMSGSFIGLDVDLSGLDYFGSSRNGALNWFDFNNDGFWDICLIQGESFSAKMKIFKNNGNKTFTDIKCDSILTIVPGTCGPSFADYDNDGDLDILLMGRNLKTNTNEIIIYENLGDGKFVDSGIRNITGIIKSRMPWCDFNNDGLMDILANEPNADGTSTIVIYKNTNNKSFTKITLDNLKGLNNDYLNQAGDMRWGDYNNDGYADIIISGANTGSNGTGITKIYKNNGNETFTDSGIGNIYGMAMDVSIEWGDYNNDGMLDILQTGDGWINGVKGKTRIYYNNNGTFEKEADESFLEVHQLGMSTAADYDNDGDLDILDLGQVSYTHHQIALFDNFQPVKNSKPTVPSNLKVSYQNNEVLLSWNRASDKETPSNGLSYNVYINSALGSIVAPASLKTGKRTIVALGNTNYNNFMRIKNLPIGKYIWSVQSIDNCFEGSEFAPENTFEILKTGIDKKIPNLEDIAIYPNPFSDHLTIETPNCHTKKSTIIVTDLMGKQILNIKNISLPYQLNTKPLISGVYFISITQDNLTCVKKIIKK